MVQGKAIAWDALSNEMLKALVFQANNAERISGGNNKYTWQFITDTLNNFYHTWPGFKIYDGDILLASVKAHAEAAVVNGGLGLKKDRCSPGRPSLSEAEQ